MQVWCVYDYIYEDTQLAIASSLRAAVQWIAKHNGVDESDVIVDEFHFARVRGTHREYPIHVVDVVTETDTPHTSNT